LVKDGIPLPPPEPLQQSDAGDAVRNVVADDPSDNANYCAEPAAESRGELSLRRTDLPADQDRPADTSDASDVSARTGLGDEQTVAAVVGAAALGSGLQRSWERRVDRAMKKLGDRSLNKISRLCRRRKRTG
jgi:hypothetical protein